MMLVGRHERERASRALSDHYSHGRITVDELAERTALVLRARSAGDLRRALRGLPRLRHDDLPDLQARAGTFARKAARGAILLALVGTWLSFSLVLLVALAVVVAVSGASLTTLLVFPLVWATGTYLLSLAWRRAPR
jgi:hypothetical protein